MRKIELYAVEPLLFGYMFCSFLSTPVEVQLTYRKVCLQEFQNRTICDSIINSSNKSHIQNQNIVQKNAAHWGIYLDIGRCGPALIMTILYGALLDRFGRKIIMIFPIIGDLANIVFQFINSYYMDLHVSYLMIGVTCSAFFGGFACFLASVFSYIADISDKSTRTKRVIILECMLYLGAIASNLSGGILLDKYGFPVVYILLICGYVCQIIYWCLLSESYQPVVNDKKPDTRAFIKLFLNLERAKEYWNIIKNSRDRLKMYLYFSCFSVSVSLFVAINSVSVLYLLRNPLDFTPAQIGYFIAEFNGIKFVGALLLNYVLVHSLKWLDYSMIFLSAIFYAAFAISITFVKTHIEVYLAVMCTFGMGVACPSSRSGLSKLVSPTEQGRMFAMIAILEVLISLSASPLAKYIYEQSVDVSPALVYYVMAACTFFLFLFTSILKFISDKHGYNELQDADDVLNDEVA